MDRPHPIIPIDSMAVGLPAPDSLVHGNLLEFLDRTPDGWADLVVTSPPYWKLVDYDGDGARQADISGGQLGLEDTPEEYAERMADIFLAVAKKIKPSGHMVINIKDTYMARRRRQATQTRHKAKSIGRAGSIAKHPVIPCKSKCFIPEMLAERIMRLGGYPCRSQDIWYDHSRMPESRVKDRHWQKTEYVYHFSMSQHSYSRFSSGGGSPGPNMLSVLHKTGVGKHHATMPLGLAAEYIDFLCPEGGTVFDPFGGEGTTAVVARAMGRPFVLTEIVREFCESAAGRIAKGEDTVDGACSTDVVDAVVERVGGGNALVAPEGRGRKSLVPLDLLRHTGACSAGDRLSVMIETRKTYVGSGKYAVSQVFHYMPPSPAHPE